jgi:hypothetical protein
METLTTIAKVTYNYCVQIVTVKPTHIVVATRMASANLRDANDMQMVKRGNGINIVLMPP